MTRVVRNAALLCVAGIFVASAALANVPDPAHSNVGTGKLTVEGTTNGLPDDCLGLPNFPRCGDITVLVRDFANNVIAGSIVVIDFTNCSDINLSCDQSANPGQTYLSTHKVQGTTNSLGQYTFKVQGGGPTIPYITGPNGAGTNAGAACATVYADGVPIGNLKVAAYDIDAVGSGTVNQAVNLGTDASKVKQEAVNAGNNPAQARARDDYDFNGVVNIAGDVANITQFALDQQNGSGSRDTKHTGYATWPSAGTPAGFCP
jgi:hypothetical protein